MVDIQGFFADFDVEPLRARVLEDEGIDICGVYCLATGAKIGTFDSSVIEGAIDSIDYDDEETLVDDLIVRVVASMRPSPLMNKMDRFTVREMVARRPVDAFAFLANRLNGTRYTTLHRDGEVSFQPLYNRIAIHHRWSQLAADGLDLTPWIHWLLEVDAKMNLHDVSPPCISLDKTNNWILSREGTALLMLVTVDNAEELLGKFESWAFTLLGEYDDRDKRLIREANWTRGNSFAGAAYTRSWLENPEIANRKHAEELARKKKGAKAGRKPVSERTLKLNAEVDQFLHLLEGIMDGTVEDAPKPAPAKPRVLLGGALKLNIAGRK